MKVSDFDYHLPPELIAQEPLGDRAASRMLVLNRAQGTWSDRTFRELPGYLVPGDCLALNDTRVRPCRLLGQIVGKPREAEIFLLRQAGEDAAVWEALARPGRHLGSGARVRFSGSLHCEVLSVGARGERTVRMAADGTLEEEIERCGHMPLPPYIRRPDHNEDRARYQTVYASATGSAAAPTAGLHFTQEVLEACRARGATVARVTLHVGLGTFQPLAHENVEDNHLHRESFSIAAADAELMRGAKRIVAAGTTTVRTLETAMRRGSISAMQGETDIFLYPGCRFEATGALLTNFHLPKSSLLMLVCAFAGRELTLEAYRYAVVEGYRFFSYGDCMLIL
jgi:S-adenosylmethionine:tRNA ribosyltransferase-isomerase